MVRFLKQLHHDTSGATAVEYGLIVGLIAIAAIAAIQGVAAESTRMWNDIETRSVEAMSK